MWEKRAKTRGRVSRLLRRAVHYRQSHLDAKRPETRGRPKASLETDLTVVPIELLASDQFRSDRLIKIFFFNYTPFPYEHDPFEQYNTRLSIDAKYLKNHFQRLPFARSQICTCTVLGRWIVLDIFSM